MCACEASAAGEASAASTGGKVWSRAGGGIKGGCMRIMRIRLNFQDRFTREYEVEPSSTVLALKQRISVIIGILTHQFWFSTELRILEDEETFEHAGIVDEEELYVEGVIDRVLPVYVHVPAYHPAGGDDALKNAGLALQADLAALQRLA
jgi:hypothetical protein